MIAHLFIAAALFIMAVASAFAVVEAYDLRRYGIAAFCAAISGGLVATCVAILLRLLGGE